VYVCVCVSVRVSVRMRVSECVSVHVPVPAASGWFGTPPCVPSPSINIFARSQYPFLSWALAALRNLGGQGEDGGEGVCVRVRVRVRSLLFKA